MTNISVKSNAELIKLSCKCNFLLEKEKKLIENLPDFVKQLKDMYNEYRNK